VNRGERDLSTLDGLPSLNAAQPLSRAGGKLFCGTGLGSASAGFGQATGILSYLGF
jgi:hypothetical protein